MQLSIESCAERFANFHSTFRTLQLKVLSEGALETVVLVSIDFARTLINCRWSSTKVLRLLTSSASDSMNELSPVAVFLVEKLLSTSTLFTRNRLSPFKLIETFLESPDSKIKFPSRTKIFGLKVDFVKFC